MSRATIVAAPEEPAIIQAERIGTSMKPVIIVSYYYPPEPAVGGVRPSKFAAYLPSFGWQPVVVTAAPARRDQAGAEQLRHPTLYRATEWWHPLKMYERMRERAAVKEGKVAAHAAKLMLPYAQCHHTRGGLKRWLLAFLWLPDRETGWLVPAVHQALRAIRESGARHLITTGPPFTAHLVGWCLHRLTGVKWIADFRDPWSLRHKFPVFRHGMTDAIESRLIRAVLRRADLILSVTPAMTDEMKKEHADLSAERFQTLMSGFDPDDFSQIEWSRPFPDPVVFSYFGTFYHGRTPEPFLGALKSLLDDGSLKPRDVRVRFVGQVNLADGQPVADMVRHLGLESLVSLHPPVPRREALKQTLESHVVLVLDERHPVQIPLKLYDALASGATVFNIGSGGAAAEVLERTRRGVAVGYERPADVRAGILECVKRAHTAVTRSVAAPWEDAAIQEFHFRRLTERLANHLNALNTR